MKNILKYRPERGADQQAVDAWVMLLADLWRRDSQYVVGGDCLTDDQYTCWLKHEFRRALKDGKITRSEKLAEKYGIEFCESPTRYEDSKHFGTSDTSRFTKIDWESAHAYQVHDRCWMDIFEEASSANRARRWTN